MSDSHSHDHRGFSLVEALISTAVLSIIFVLIFQVLKTQSRQALSISQGAKEGFMGSHAIQRFASDVRGSGSNQVLEIGHFFYIDGIEFPFGVNPMPEGDFSLVSFYSRNHPFNPSTGFHDYSYPPRENWPALEDIEWPLNLGDSVTYRLADLDGDGLLNDFIREDMKFDNIQPLAKNIAMAEIHYSTSGPDVNFPSLMRPMAIVRLTPDEGRTGDVKFNLVEPDVDQDYIAYVRLILTFPSSEVGPSVLDSGPIRKWVRR